MADELLEEMSKDLENKAFKSNFTPVVRVKEGRTPCLEIDNKNECVKPSCTWSDDRNECIPSGSEYCCSNGNGKCHSESQQDTCNEGEVRYRQVTTDDDGNIVFDGFVEEHDEYNMHLILQKVFYYVRPNYTLPEYPRTGESKEIYKREYGEWKRRPSASSPSPPWISKHAIDNIAAIESEDNSKYKGAHPNGMCTPSYTEESKKCAKEYTYLMDLFDIVGRYTPKPPNDEYKSDNEYVDGRGDEDDDDSNANDSGEDDDDDNPVDSDDNDDREEVWNQLKQRLDHIKDYMKSSDRFSNRNQTYEDHPIAPFLDYIGEQSYKIIVNKVRSVYNNYTENLVINNENPTVSEMNFWSAVKDKLEETMRKVSRTI